MAASSDRLNRLATLLAPAIVLIGCALLLFDRVHTGVGVFDEGFVVAGAMQVRQGAWPLRDFFTLYGPAQYLLTAGAFSVFGEDLWVSRCLHLGVLAAIGLLVVGAASRLSGGRWWVGVGIAIAWLLVSWRAEPPPGYAAVLATLGLLGAATALAWAADAAGGAAARSRLLVCSLFIGAVATVRWDFGLFGALAMPVAWWLAGSRGQAWPGVLATLLRLWLPAAGVAAIGLLPFIIAGGAQRWFDEVVLFYAREFETWRGLRLVAPTLQAANEALALRALWSLARAAWTLVYAFAPPLLIAATLLHLARLRLHGRPAGAATTLAAALACTGLLLLMQMRVRPGWSQGYPAFVLALPLLALAAPALERAGAALRWVAAATAMGLFVILPAYVVQGDWRQGALMRAEPPLARARGVQIDGSAALARWAEYAALVEHLRRITRPGEPIFSGVTDTSRLFINDAMLYFLVARRPGTRWIEMEPGQTNTARGQHELIEELERSRVRVLVLWDKRSFESNASGRSNGVTDFDDFVRTRFRLDQRFGAYAVMIRNAP
jgi:hypothetical protein